MTKRIAISQSNYLPWKGYFRTIASVDEFVLYDEVQYTRRDWRNRNRVKTASGTRWLSVPVEVKGRFEQRVDETHIADAGWARSHWSAIEQAYRSAPCFDEFAPAFAAYYESTSRTLLSDVNRDLIEIAMHAFGIVTPLTWSTDYSAIAEGQTERLVDICVQAEASTYLSGPAAKAYLDESAFGAVGIGVEYVDYSGFDEYPQLHGEFEHSVAVIDLLFNAGADIAMVGAT